MLTSLQDRDDGNSRARENQVDRTDRSPEPCKLAKKLNNLRRNASKNPLDAQCWYKYAVFLHEQFDAGEETITALLNAQSLLPDKDLRLRLGDALVRTGQVKKGLRQICEFLSAHPTAFAYRLLGSHLTDCQKRKRARKFLRKALVLDPDHEETYYLLGELLSRTAKRESISFYRKAIAIDPTYQLAWRSLGSVLLRGQNSVRKGIAALKRAIELDSTDAWSMMCLAQGYRLIEQPAMARRYYKNALRIDPTNALYQEYYKSSGLN